MTSSITRQKILCHTYYEILHRVNAFNHIDYDQPYAWRLLADSLERAAEALRVQAADYGDALDYEEEAARQAEAEYRKEKDAEETDPIF
jgi:hypothetical protein